MEFIRRLQLVDRRLVYIALVVVLSVPFIWTYKLKVYPAEYPRRFYNGVQTIADANAKARENGEREKVVLLLSNWGPGTSGENKPQMIAVLRHLLRERVRFVLISSVVDPVVHEASMAALEEAKNLEVQRARRLKQPIPKWVYGEDYIDFGFRNAPVFSPLAVSIVAQTREFYARDYVNRRDLTNDDSYPLFKHYRDINDVAAVLIVSAGDEAKDVAGLVKPSYPHLLIASATMGIVANDLYPYVRSGQMFGLLNSSRGALEYAALLTPDESPAKPVDNSMSLGKVFLLALVLLGNLAFAVTRWAERTGRLRQLDPKAPKPPLPPLPRGVLVGLFVAFVAAMSATTVYEFHRISAEGRVPRLRAAQADDDPKATYPRTERVGLAELERQAMGDAASTGDAKSMALAPQRAKALYADILERRIGDFLSVILTFGVLAFLLGDNNFYRFFEAIIVGGGMAFMLLAIPDVLGEWYASIIGAVRGLFGAAPPANGEAWPHWPNIFWILLLIPGALWYFTYSKKLRWLNQMLVAAFLGLVLGNEFEKQTGIVLPQIIDTIRPIWPLDTLTNVENLAFVLVAVLSLSYFVFSFRPKGAVGNGYLTAGRLAMMLGFGVMFGNTVNTRLSWLAPQIGLIWEDWIGKLLGW